MSFNDLNPIDNSPSVISHKSYRKPIGNNTPYQSTTMAERTGHHDMPEIPIVPLTFSRVSVSDNKDVNIELLAKNTPIGFTADKIQHLQVSLPALAAATGMTARELIACPPDEFRKRLEHAYSTKAREEADQLLLKEAAPIEEAIEKVVNDFKKDLYEEVLKVKKRMSLAYNLTERQRDLLTQWKDTGNREEARTDEEIEWIIEWSDSYSKNPFSLDNKEFLREWMKPLNRRIQGIRESEIESPKKWLIERNVECETGVQPLIPAHIRDLTEEEKQTFIKWKTKEAISDRDIEVIDNYLSSAKTLDNKAILLALMTKRISPPYRKEDADLLNNMLSLRINFKFTYGSFSSVLENFHKNFHAYQKNAADERRDLEDLKTKWNKDRISKDKSLSRPLKNQMTVLNTAAARYTKEPSTIVDALGKTHEGTKKLSDGLDKMEGKLSDIEDEKGWFTASTNWNIKQELSLCCYCSANKYDTYSCISNSFLADFYSKYKRGYYKYAQKPKLEYDADGFVIPIDQELPKKEPVGEGYKASGTGVRPIISTDDNI